MRSITSVTHDPTALVAEAGPARIDPLAPAPRGTWFGHGVRVRRRTGPHRRHTDANPVCTERFCVDRRGGVLTVVHDLTSRRDLRRARPDAGRAGSRPGFCAASASSSWSSPVWCVRPSTAVGRLAAVLPQLHRHDSRTASLPFAPIHERAAQLVDGCQPDRPRIVLRLLSAADGRDRNRRLGNGSERPHDAAAGSGRHRMRRPLRTLCCDAPTYRCPTVMPTP